MLDQYTNEAIVVYAKYAAIGLGHFVEHLEGLIDESGFHIVHHAAAVYEAVDAKTVIHIREKNA